MGCIRRRVFIASLVLIAAAASGWSTAAEPAAARPRVLLVSIDGLMPDDYLRADELGLKVPTLRRLMQAGAYARVKGVLPSVTYPSHTTLISGVPPRVHGIDSNTLFDPHDRSGDAWYWFASDIRVPTLVSAARARWLGTASLSWPVSVGNGADFNVPEVWRPGSSHPVDLQFLDALSTPHLMRGLEAWTGRKLTWPLSDDDRADAAIFLLRTQRPELMLLHLIDLDFARHAHGPRAPEAHAAVEKSDARLGRVLDALRETGLDESTLVAVVSDHGFIPVTQDLHPNALLRAAGLLRVDARGRVESWRAYFHTNGGSAALKLRDPADREALEQVRALVDARLREPGSGLQAVLEPEAIAAQGGPTDVPLVLDAREGFHFSSDAAGEWLSPAKSRGSHGYSPERPEMQAALVAAAPAMKRRGDLGLVPMTSIAATLARYLGVELSTQAGPPLSLFE